MGERECIEAVFGCTVSICKIELAGMYWEKDGTHYWGNNFIEDARIETEDGTVIASFKDFQTNEIMTVDTGIVECEKLILRRNVLSDRDRNIAVGLWKIYGIPIDDEDREAVSSDDEQ